jgi:hypothetical protein
MTDRGGGKLREQLEAQVQKRPWRRARKRKRQEVKESETSLTLETAVGTASIIRALLPLHQGKESKTKLRQVLSRPESLGSSFSLGSDSRYANPTYLFTTAPQSIVVRRAWVAATIGGIMVGGASPRALTRESGQKN